MSFLTLLILSVCISSAFLRLTDETFTLSRNYNESESLEYAWVSKLAYCDPKSVPTWSCGQPCEKLSNYTFMHGEDVLAEWPEATIHYVILKNTLAKKIVVAFRGTNNDEQAIFEVLGVGGVEYDLHNIPGAMVFGYFFDAYKKYARTNFLSNLTSILSSCPPDFQVVFTGHSLGAALTTLAAHDALYSNIVSSDRTRMFTFGSPRVGNAEFAFSLNKVLLENFRVVHFQDLYAHMPPCWFNDFTKMFKNCTLNDSFRVWQPWHAGTEIFYDTEESNEYRVCDLNYGETPDCADQFGITSLHPSDHWTYLNITINTC